MFGQVLVVLRIRCRTYLHESSAEQVALSCSASVLAIVAAAYFVGDVLWPMHAKGADRAALDLLSVIATAVGGVWILFPLLSGVTNSGVPPRYLRWTPLHGRAASLAVFTSTLIGFTFPLTVGIYIGACVFAVLVTHRGAVDNVVPQLGIAVCAGLLMAIMTALLSRVVLMLASRLVGNAVQSIRRSAFAVAFVLVVALVLPAAPQLVTEAGGWPAAITLLAQYSPWALPVRAATTGGSALWQLGIPIAIVVIAAGAWDRLIRAEMHCNQKAVRPGRSQRGAPLSITSIWSRIPRTPVAAATFREMQAWRVDPRRRSQLLIVISLTAVTGIGPLLFPGLPFTAQYGAWFVVFAAMSAARNSYGLDGRSFWHLLTIPGAVHADIRGRQIAWLALVLPCAASAIAAATFSTVTPPGATPRIAIAITAGMILAGLGTFPALSAAFPIPARAADKTFSLAIMPNLSGPAALSTYGAMLVMAIPPAAAVAATYYRPHVTWLPLALSAALGAMIALAGSRFANHLVLTRGSSILARVSTEVA